MKTRFSSLTGQTVGMDNPNPLEISIDELAKLISDGITLIDVRMEDEYLEGHVPGAKLMPLDQIEERSNEVPSDRDVYLICRSGGRSAKAQDVLNAKGRKCINVAGGTLGWIEAGHKTIEGPNES
jgi:rhodanese-related sulfurtransferase